MNKIICRIFLAILSLSVCVNIAFTQGTGFRLSTLDNTSWFFVDNKDSVSLLRCFGDGGFYVLGTYDYGQIPITGPGVRMMWYPKKAAFRAGYVDGIQWDDVNIGLNSVAMGYLTTASGNRSTAMGSSTIASDASSTAMGCFSTASGYISTAMGYSTTASGKESTSMGRVTVASGHASTAMGDSSIASGSVSTAIGFRATASAPYSTAMGWQTSARGKGSTAMGWVTTASGNNSIAMGEYTTADGWSSTAMGGYTIASGNNSTAMGNYVSTNSLSGAFIIGDNSTITTTNSSDANQMTMRFNGGYQFYSNSDFNNGCIYEWWSKRLVLLLRQE